MSHAFNVIGMIAHGAELAKINRNLMALLNHFSQSKHLFGPLEMIGKACFIRKKRICTRVKMQ